MQQTWRWFGPTDRVTLQDARQAGAEGIVTSLQEVPPGEVWTPALIEARRQTIGAAGLQWTVVESLEISERIKTRSPGWQRDVAAFNDSLRNLAAQGIRIVAYNFMPVFSWVRTGLRMRLPHGGTTTVFDAIAFAAFDLFVLQRQTAEEDWSQSQCRQAHEYYQALSESQKQELQQTILQGLPGGQKSMRVAELRQALAPYQGLDRDHFRAHAGDFLRMVSPVAEELGVRLAVHPDDPPRPLLGLPRIVSTADDLAWWLQQAEEPANGLTFCTGALGVRADNALAAMAERFASRIWFAHLRSTQRMGSPSHGDIESFFEAAHLEGDADLVEIVRILAKERARRRQRGDVAELPFRCDHGQELLNDEERGAAAGYPAAGRMRGLAELRGVMQAVERFSLA